MGCAELPDAMSGTMREAGSVALVMEPVAEAESVTEPEPEMVPDRIESIRVVETEPEVVAIEQVIEKIGFESDVEPVPIVNETMTVDSLIEAEPPVEAVTDPVVETEEAQEVVNELVEILSEPEAEAEPLIEADEKLIVIESASVVEPDADNEHKLESEPAMPEP
eukprot:gene11991-15254_t